MADSPAFFREEGGVLDGCSMSTVPLCARPGCLNSVGLRPAPACKKFMEPWGDRRSSRATWLDTPRGGSPMNGKAPEQ